MKLAILLFLGLFCLKGHAFPEAPFNALEPGILLPFDPLSQSYNFEGIVKLSNCSGAIVIFKGQPLSSKAFVLTNGHCIEGRFLRFGEVVENKRSRRRMKVADKRKRFHRIRAEKIVYATMTGTDAALYQLSETYDDLDSIGISPFELSDFRPYLETEIEIISGYWERGYSCYIDAFIYKLLEAKWIFKDSIRYSDQGCEIIGGTSGSPIIRKGSRTVIGVNNTKNESGRRCTRNNPCEVDQNENIVVKRERGYGQQTYLFYSCLNDDYEIDLKLNGCLLAK